MTERRWWVSSTTITEEGKKTRLNLQTLVISLVLVGVVGWALAEFGKDSTGTGPNGSLFVTDVNGAAALGELLAELGHPVVPAVAPLTGLEAGGTLMILEPGFRTEYLEEEIDAIRSWVEDGGRLVVSGRPHPDLLGSVLPADLRLGFSGASPAPVVSPVREIGGEIITAGVYTAETDAAGLALAGDPPVAIAFERGAGTIVYIADGSILWNPTLEENGAWLVSLVPEGPVRFDEVRHGFTAQAAAENPTGLLAALPERVRHVVLLLMPVLLAAIVTYGRRFGPPEDKTRQLAPPRRELVDAVAGLLTRMPNPVEAAEPVTNRLREAVSRRAGLPGDADDQALLAGAPEIAIDRDELESALSARDEETMLVAQRLLARLSEREHL